MCAPQSEEAPYLRDKGNSRESSTNKPYNLFASQYNPPDLRWIRCQLTQTYCAIALAVSLEKMISHELMGA
jgi:hypothetical protein